MRIKLFAACVVAAAMLLVGCESEGGVTDDPEVGSNSQSEDTEDVEEITSDEKAAPEYAAFGETYKWDDLEVTIGAPTPFTPSEWAATSGQFSDYLAFEVVVVNTGSEPYDPMMFYATVQSGSSEGDEVFDTENGFEGSPMTPVLPSREARFKVGFGVEDPADLVMQIAPSWDHEPAIFTS